MKDSSVKKQSGKKGKQFTVVRNFNGSLTAEEFVTNLLKTNLEKEKLKQRGDCDEI